MKDQIGLAAGQIYRYLRDNGENSTATLKKELKIEDSSLVALGLGWLAREGKVSIRTKGKSLLVALTNGA